MGMVPPFNFFGPGGAIVVGLLAGIPGGRKRDAIESLIMKLGNAEGYGNGFISGSMMNFRAIISIIGPLTFGTMYAWGKKKGMPQLPFVFAALTVLASEGIFRSISNADLGLDAKGQSISAKRD